MRVGTDFHPTRSYMMSMGTLCGRPCIVLCFVAIPTMAAAVSLDMKVAVVSLDMTVAVVSLDMVIYGLRLGAGMWRYRICTAVLV